MRARRARARDVYRVRATELGCENMYPRAICTETGACDYAEFVEHVRQTQSAQTCEELSELLINPCVRPSAETYWRTERD